MIQFLIFYLFIYIVCFSKSDERDEMIGHKLLSKEEIIRKVINIRFFKKKIIFTTYFFYC